jgi:energy-coupling factor transporter ATP-binding protein EcfA2
VLNNIEFSNYRGFEHYDVDGLSRVNLLVGRNNCGKTSILEAINILASGGDPAVMVDIAERRGEVLLSEGPERFAGPRRSPVLSHFFHGHSLYPGLVLRLVSRDGLGEVIARVVNVADDAEFSRQRLLDLDEPTSSALALYVEGGRYLSGLDRPIIPMSDEGAVSAETVRRLVRGGRFEGEVASPVTFISPDSLEQYSMSSMWNKVILQGREAEVVAAMRILEPHLASIHFLTGGSNPRYGGSAGILVGLKGFKERVPLGSYGDGMRRLLALSIALIRSAGGYLLLDEIDTGLHYSVMGDMWKLVVSAAMRSSVQVYATTHSLDCIQGLRWLSRNHPELYDQVTVHKIEPGLGRSVPLSGHHLLIAIEQEMEIR